MRTPHLTAPFRKVSKYTNIFHENRKRLPPATRQLTATRCGRTGRTDVRLILKPMADGGEGSLGILAGDEGEYHPVETFDALMRPVQSAYAVLPGNSGKYAAVEAASAVGLYRLDREERNPLRTTSYGVGKVMREAIEAGCTELIAAVGGTATSDCGAGMLAALGCRFLDGQNRLIDYPAGGDLIRFDAIDTAPLYHLTQGCRFKVLTGTDAAIRKAALAVTGEGRFDSQSLHGKVAGHIASFAHAHGIPTIVLCGSRGEDMTADILAPAGISALFALTDRVPRHEAFTRPAESLARLTAEVFGYLLAE